MRRIDAHRYADMAALQRAARGDEPADLAVVNCRLVDVLTLTVRPAELFVHRGVIVHVESDERNFAGRSADARRVYDAGGAFVAPGLLDSHVHCESSMLTPYQFGRAMVRHGTTAAFTDPHEIANVAGREGVRYMLENGRNFPARQFALIPSCVPSVVGLESAGASFTAVDIREIAGWNDPGIVGLAEVMDYVGVIASEARMSAILDAATEAGLYLQSHFYRLSGRPMSAYLVRGMGGNHELRSAEELIEVLGKGGWADLKGASSISDAFDSLLEGLKTFPHPEVLRVTLCTDDVHAKDISEKGHVNRVVRRLIDAGFDPVFALACATRNTAREYGISNLGSLAVGNLADFIVLPDLETVQPNAVFVGGEQVVENGTVTIPEDPALARPSPEVAPYILNTVRLNPVSASDLKIRVSDAGKKAAAVNVIDFAVKVTELRVEEIPVTDGCLDISGIPDLAFAAVFNRYGTGSRTLAVIRNFGLKHGAIASTVSHDSHNLTVVYRDPEAAARLIAAIAECGGGIGGMMGEDRKIVELPIAGLMSPRPASEIIAEQSELKALYERIFETEDISILKPVSLSLIVSPKFKVSDMGIVDVLKQEFVPLFPERTR